MRKWIREAVWCACCAAMLAGCAENKMDMSSMKPPARSSELDRLDAWVGNWSSTGEATMDGKCMKMTGTSTVAWDCDKRVLVEHATEDMEKMGKSTSIILYAWDCDENAYKVAYFSSMGESNMGHMKWDSKKGCFTMRGKGKNPMTHQTTIFDMEIRMPNNNTMEFNWAEWDGLHLKKLGEGKGSAHKS